MKTLQFIFGENNLNTTQMLLVKGGNEPMIGATDANENHTNFDEPIVI